MSTANACCEEYVWRRDEERELDSELAYLDQKDRLRATGAAEAPLEEAATQLSAKIKEFDREDATRGVADRGGPACRTDERWGPAGEQQPGRAHGGPTMSRLMRDMETEMNTAGGDGESVAVRCSTSETPTPARPSKRRRLEALAYHEAGHAVMAHVHQVEISHVTVEPWNGVAGEVRFTREGLLVRRETPAVDIAVMLAGHLAHYRFTGTWNVRSAPCDDFRKARESAGRATSGAEARVAFVQQRWMDTWDLLCRPEHWAAVEAVVTALLDEPYLVGDAVHELIDRTIMERRADPTDLAGGGSEVRPPMRPPIVGPKGGIRPALDPVRVLSKAQLTRLAYHQAGHAVVAHAKHLELERIGIGPQYRSPGTHLVYAPQTASRPRKAPHPGAEIMVLFGGELARDIVTGSYWGEGSLKEQGRNEAWRLARRTIVDEDKQVAYLERLFRRTNRLLERPKYRAAVEAVATELLSIVADGRDQISGRRAREVIGRVLRCPTPPRI